MDRMIDAYRQDVLDQVERLQILAAQTKELSPETAVLILGLGADLLQQKINHYREALATCKKGSAGEV